MEMPLVCVAGKKKGQGFHRYTPQVKENGLGKDPDNRWGRKNRKQPVCQGTRRRDGVRGQQRGQGGT